MNISIALIIFFIVSFILIIHSKIKHEYVFLLFFMTCGVLSDLDTKTVIKNIIFAFIAFILFVITTKIKANQIIKSSFIITYISIFLLIIALWLPRTNGTHRYIDLGFFTFEPATLVVFSILPICTYINMMKHPTQKDLFLPIGLASIELGLVYMLPDIKLMFLMGIIFLIMLIKIKLDNRINISWLMVATIISVFTIICICILFQPYNVTYLINLLTRGENDPLGSGYQIQITDAILKSIRIIGEADLDNIYGYADIINNMPFLSFAIKSGWICVVLLIIAFITFIVKLYLMSVKIKNSFARYTCFGITTYFAFGSIFHVFAEIVTGSYASYFIFMGSSTNFIIHSILLSIIFTLYNQRNKITIGRQLDIDYDMTHEVLENFKSSYKMKLQNPNTSRADAIFFNSRIEEIEVEQKSWQKKEKSLHEINKKYQKYEKELGLGNDIKDLVFISYNHFDEKYAAYLCDQIESLGIKSWHFKRDMKSENGNNDYAISIRKAIRKAKVFVVILSNHSMASEHVKNEVCLAFNQISQGTIIMPITIDEVSIEDDETFGYYLCRQDITSALTPPIKNRLKEFAKKIETAYK